MRIWLTILILLMPWVAGASTWFAATNGTSGGSGAIGSPWSLSKALSFTSGNTILPGDTVYLRDGTYWISNTITSYLAGTSNAPVVVRSYPGEWAKLAVQDTNTVALSLNADGSNTWYWGFEVCNVSPDRANRQAGIMAFASGSKFINLVIHDVGVGIYADGAASPAEWSGCLCFFNGCTNSPNLYHGIYCHSMVPGNTIRDNICFDNTGYGIHCYAALPFTPFLDGLRIFGNIGFCGGIVTGARVANFLTGGDSGVAVRDLIFRDNYGFQPSGVSAANYEMGYQSHPQGDCIVYNNYFAGGGASVDVWTNIVHTNNTYLNFSTYFSYNPNYSISGGAYTWDRNVFYNGFSYRTNGGPGTLTIPQWQSVFGFDAHSAFNSKNPTTPAVFIRTNAYDSSRAMVAIYNWGLSPTVSVDLSGILTVGNSFKVINAQNYFSTPVVSGDYAGGTVAIPMNGLSVATPVGLSPPPTTSPQFGAFVVIGGQTATKKIASVTSFSVQNLYSP